jgi:murein DD-endopeptidase MepM/ murein hydrolase activator NlpD
VAGPGDRPHQNHASETADPSTKTEKTLGQRSAFACGFSAVKVLIAAAIVVVSVTTIPVVMFGGDTIPTVQACGHEQLDVILSTIRTIETGGNYTTTIASSSASGAYAFLDTTWRRHATGVGIDANQYPRAYQAPPELQDRTAAAFVAEILDSHNRRVEAVPVVWYLGHEPPSGSPQWDTVPAPGNTLTPRQYQTKWIAQYHKQLQRNTTDTSLDNTAGDSTPDTLSSTQPQPTSCTSEHVDAPPGDWSLPGPRSLLEANPAVIDSPHHDYPAWDWLIPLHTPIYAVRSGNVDVVFNWPHNWWTNNCQQDGRGGCTTCGVGITIVDNSGYRWTYCHGTTLTVDVHDTVTAGQQILWSGNTGRSGVPHLHLEIRTDTTRRCPQPLIDSIYHHGVGIDPATLPSGGCSY